MLDPAGSLGIFEIVGGPGSGKTTALAHLAALVPADRHVQFLDDAPTEAIVEAAGRGPVVFTSLRTRQVPGARSLLLAPWGEGELLEYLLAVHHGRCGSVMARLRAAVDRDLPQGCPELWRAVLDRMAEDESLASVSAALRRELEAGLTTAELRSRAEEYSLAVLRGQWDDAGPFLPDVGPRTLAILRHDPARIMLAADRLARLLEADVRRDVLDVRLPRELVTATAAAMSAGAVARLRAGLTNMPAVSQPMAASLLHAADPGWVPEPTSMPHLTGAYLAGARWRGADLRKASLVEADLSDADLTGATLSGAMAPRAVFARAVLHEAALLNIDAIGADFGWADLTRADARGALLVRANLACADLTCARLSGTRIWDAILDQACVARADLRHAILTGASIDGADFSSADLGFACLSRLSLRMAAFAGARFPGAKLDGCDLEGMDLPGADFASACLLGAILTGSRMRGAIFAQASLRRAALAEIDWEDADLHGADLRECSFHMGSTRCGLVDSPIASEGTRTGFYGDDFDDQTYRPPEEIRKANLCSADLRDAQIEGTDFYLVDLRGAQYGPEQFDHFRRCGAILFDRA